MLRLPQNNAVIQQMDTTIRDSFAQVAITDACEAVIDHGAARRAYKGLLILQRLPPSGDADTEHRDGGCNGAAAAAAASDGAKAGGTSAGQMLPMTSGQRAKPPPQPLRQKPQQQRQKKGKRKR